MTLNTRVSRLERLVKPGVVEIKPPLDESLPPHLYKMVKENMAKGNYEPNMTIEKFHEIRNAVLAEDDC